MKLSENDILGMENSFKEWEKQKPEFVGKIKEDLMENFGYDEVEMTDSNLTMIKIPVEKLGAFSTSSGTISNQPFTDEVISFLKSKKVEFMVAITDLQSGEISFAIMKISEKNAEKFSEMIEKNKGVLRFDFSKILGWSTFESE